MTISELHSHVSRLIEDGFGDCRAFLHGATQQVDGGPARPVLFELCRLRPRLVATVRKSDGDKTNELRVDMEFDATPGPVPAPPTANGGKL